ncbi:hypothetical protein NLG97_g7040 [Lecanicillium saksenae]|uniref:Uncharacterized protein n=1 Tax=Lecanicillium saksenae TaxID=468837 RepID=A0ACC1QMX5_9HYPO|nr:hypothetical protein NLG97_g7040 [Lecanicillium saksenae]
MAPQRLDNLAPELVVDIARHLWLGDMSRLARANRRLHRILEPFMYLTDAQPYNQYALFWAAEHNLPTVAERALRAGSPAEPAGSEPAPDRPFGKLLVTDEDLRALGDGQRYPTPLGRAAAAGSSKVVAVLLRHAATLQLPQIFESIKGAAQNGHVETVEMILHYSEHVFKNEIAEVASAVFSAAAMKGQRAVLDRLLETHKGLPSTATFAQSCRTAMLGAASEGYDDVWDLLSSIQPLERVNPDSCATLLYSLFEVPAAAKSSRGMVELSEQIISFGLDLNNQAQISRLARLAAYRNDVPLTELFLKYSKEEPRERESILSSHHFYGSPDVIKMLLARGISHDICERNFLRALHHRDLVIAQLFFSSMGGSFKFTSDNGVNIMYQVCGVGFPEAVEQLLKQGIPASPPRDGENNTKARRTFLQALMCRRRETERLKIAEMLIKAGADPLQDTGANTSLLAAACEAGLPTVARLLLRHGADALEIGAANKTTLHIACVYSPDVDLIRDLIERGADVTARTLNDSTPLHELCLTGRGGWTRPEVSRYQVAKLLIAHGADPNATNINGTAPLHHACINRPGDMKAEDAQIVEALLDNGADIEMCDSGKKTPLFLACCDLNLPVASVLLKRGADASVKTLQGFADYCANSADGSNVPGGESSLHEMVKMLLGSGVDNVMLKQMLLPPLNQRTTSYEAVRLLLMRAGGVDKETTLIFGKSAGAARTEALAKALGLVEDEDTILDRTTLTVLSWPVEKKKKAATLADEDDEMLYY